MSVKTEDERVGDLVHSDKTEGFKDQRPKMTERNLSFVALIKYKYNLKNCFYFIDKEELRSNPEFYRKPMYKDENGGVVGQNGGLEIGFATTNVSLGLNENKEDAIIQV